MERRVEAPCGGAERAKWLTLSGRAAVRPVGWSRAARDAGWGRGVFVAGSTAGEARESFSGASESGLETPSIQKTTHFSHGDPPGNRGPLPPTTARVSGLAPLAPCCI